MTHDADALCLCSSQHQPAPLELHSHHVFPLGMGGLDVPANRVWLCPTTHVNTHELLRLMLTRGPLTHHACVLLLPQPVSRYAHAVALTGYKAWRSLHDAATGQPA